MSTGSALSSKSTTPPPISRAGFVDVDRLENSNRIVSVISQRRTTGILTFGLFREFERDDGGGRRTERTSFIPADLAESYLDMVKLTIERIHHLQKNGPLPFTQRPKEPAR